MKNILKAFLIPAVLGFTACNPLQLDEVLDPNNPSLASVETNATKEQVQFLLTGLEASHRSYVTNISQAWNTFGREIWYLNASDSRFQTDWLGQAGRVPDRSYFGFGSTGGGSWASPYQAIKQADVLISSSNGSTLLVDAEKKAVAGFAKMIQGYQFMIPANFVYENGIRIDVKDPLKPGKFVKYEEALNHIKSVLDQADQDLAAAGSGAFPLKLTPGFAAYNTIPNLRKVNKAILARLNAYRKDWQGILTALDGSFLEMGGNLNAGPSHPFLGPPDAFNPLFYLPNAAINTIIVVHPSMIDDATPGDSRVTRKFFKRNTPVVVTTDATPLSALYQDARWTTNTAPIPFIRNEELILLKAEAHANLGQATEAVNAINVIRKSAALADYTGATTKDALINEILYQRRYSLWAEPWGHRWIDARRYNKLNEISTSYDKGTIFKQFPHPQAEVNWDIYVGG